MKAKSTPLFLLVLLAFTTVGVPFGIAAEDSNNPWRFDATPWLGAQRPQMATQIQNFRSLCERRTLSQLEKTLRSYDQASESTKRVCGCNEQFLRQKNDIQFIQVVNLDLREALTRLPPLPPELSLYLDSYREVHASCVTNEFKKTAKISAPTQVRKKAQKRVQRPARLPARHSN